jgi:hypothetical protein
MKSEEIMKRGRRMLDVPAMLLLAGCATMIPTDTPAQTLARQRISECAHFPSVQVREILPDGSIRIIGYGVSSVTEVPSWRACMAEALAKQKKESRAAGQGFPTIIESSEQNVL